MSKNNSFQKKLLKVLRQKKLLTSKRLIEETLETLPEEIKTEKNTRYKLQRTLKSLEGKNFIEVLPTSRSRFTRLTKKGHKKINSMKLKNEQGLASMHWDGYWRIVIMNISEERKDERDAFRYLLKKANFVCIKNSVWISPHPLEHLLENLKEDFGFVDEILIILSNKIDKKTESLFLESIRRI